MAKKTYSLEVDVEASSASLNDAIKQMEKMVSLKDKLSGGIISIPDNDVKKIIEQKTAIDALTVSIKKQDEEIKKKIKLTLDERAAKQAENAAEREAIKLKQLEIVLLDKGAGKMEKLIAANKVLTIQRNKLTGAEKDYAKQLKDINSLLDKNNAEIKENSSLLEKQKLNVGNYTESIKDALHESGLFNGTLGNMANSLLEIKKKLHDASDEGKGFGNAMKIAAVGVGLLALKALADLDQGFQDFIGNVKANIFDLGGLLGNANKQLEEASIAARQKFRDLRLEIQASTLDQEDYNEIANDTTIGFDARNKAIEESIKLGKTKAESEVKLAQLALDLANKQIEADKQNAPSGKAKEESLQKQNEAQLALNDALDKQDDLVRQNDERIRAFNVERAAVEVDLLLKKKQSYNAEKVILENKLADEKNQLEERRKIAGQLLKVNNDTTKEEIRIFKEKTGIQFNESQLLSENDAILLQRKLEGIKQTVINQKGETEQVGIGTEAIQLLAKVVKQYQENRIENDKTIKKLQEEEIKRIQTIAAIEREILELEQAQNVKLTEDSLTERYDIQEEGLEKILSGEDLFNFKVLKLRKLQVNAIKDAELDLTSEKSRLLDLQAENEKKALEISEKDNLIRAEKIKKIEEKLEIDKTNLQIDAAKKRAENAKKEQETIDKINQAQVTSIAKRLDYAAGLYNEALDKRSQAELDRIDTEQSRNDDALERQIKRAEEGKDNDVENYAEKAAELEKQKNEQLKKDRIREKITTYYALLSGYAKEDADTALSKTARDIAISEAFTAAFAAEGGIVGEVSDTTTLGSSKTHGAGLDRLVMADKREGILNVKQMQNLGGREGFYNLQNMLNNPLSDNVLFPEVPVFVGAVSPQTAKLERKMDEMIQAINNKPVPSSGLDKDMNVITSTLIANNQHIMKTITNKPPFRR